MALEAALQRPKATNFIIIFYQDRRLKFGRRNAHTKWNTMICIREDKLPQRLQSGPCVGPKAQLRPSSGASLEVTAGQHLGVSVVVPV